MKKLGFLLMTLMTVAVLSTACKKEHRVVKYTVTFEANGGTPAPPTQKVAAGKYATAPAAMTLADNTFAGWYDNATFTGDVVNFPTYQINGHTTFYAKWIPDASAVTITFETNGGSTVASKTFSVGDDVDPATFATPTKTSFMFAGWYSDAALTTPVGASVFTITEDMTFYAKWATAVTVTFNSNGGSSVTSQTIASGTTATEPTPPTKSGFDFDGWYSDAGLTTPVDWSATITANVTFYAAWIDLTAWYDISDEAEFYAIRDDLAGNYRLVADIDLSIYANWSPIGGTEDPFTGLLDGQGHTITGLTTSGSMRGLFSNVGGTVKNLTIDAPVISGTGGHSGAVSSRLSAGGLISDCIVTGGTVSTSGNPNFAGGVVGYILADGTVTHCSSSATVSSPGFGAGGIVGKMEDYSTVSACFSTGAVSGVNVVGGVVGQSDKSTVTDCYATGNVTATSNFVGGVVGQVTGGSGELTNSYASGNVSGGSGVGGVVGYIVSGCTMSNCAGNNGSVEGTGSVGRVIGYDSGATLTGNISNSGMTVTGSGGNDGTLTSLSALQTQATYTGMGWNFTTVWTMPSGTGFPILQGF